MPFKEKFQLVVVSVIVAVAIGAGLYLVFRPHITTDPNDVPIVMAGGSLYIGTVLPYSFDPDSGKTLLKYSDKMQVFRVDVYHADTSGNEKMDYVDVPPNQAGSVTLHYCMNQNGNKYDDVSLEWDTAKQITVKGTTDSIAKSSQLLPNLRVHFRKKWILDNVKVTGAGSPFDCGKNAESECHVVIHTKP